MHLNIYIYIKYIHAYARGCKLVQLTTDGERISILVLNFIL